MTEAAVSTGVLAPDVSSDMRAARSHLARRFLKNPLGIAALSVLVLIVLAVICAPLLTSYNPNGVSVLSILQGPGAGHLLGTDGAGRDVWARLLYGGRYTLAGALLATVVAAILGIVSVGASTPVTIDELEARLTPHEMHGLRAFLDALMIESGLAPGEGTPAEAVASPSTATSTTSSAPSWPEPAALTGTWLKRPGTSDATAP